jgi:hypothetical protein
VVDRGHPVVDRGDRGQIGHPVAAGANILDPDARQAEDDKDLAARSELAFYYARQKKDAAAISEYLRPAACVDPIGARGAETALAYLNSVTLREASSLGCPIPPGDFLSEIITFLSSMIVCVDNLPLITLTFSISYLDNRPYRVKLG